MKKAILFSGLALLSVASHAKNVTREGAESEPAQATAARHSLPAVVRIPDEDSTALKVVNTFFEKFRSGATPGELAACFDESAEYFIPGDTRNVPWIGKRVGRTAIEEGFRLLKANIKPEKLVFTDMLTRGDRVVVLGYLESRMKKNNKQMKSEFSIDIVVKNGLLTRYHLLEDSYEVSDKARL